MDRLLVEHAALDAEPRSSFTARSRCERSSINCVADGRAVVHVEIDESEELRAPTTQRKAINAGTL